MTESRYLRLLAERSREVGSCLCLGLDPDPQQFEAGFGGGAPGLERFSEVLLEAALPYAAAVKANLAFFEAFGSAGMAVLERVRGRLPRSVPFIADAKRADIGSTAARQAVAIWDALGADAVTSNPYLGRDAVAPFMERADRFVYVLCRTSNPGAGELQDLVVEGQPLYIHVARQAAGWAEAGNVGLVVGATAPGELARVREAAPELAFLVPGVGAQGGQVESVMHDGRTTQAEDGGGLLVNVSRGIAGAAVGARDPHPAMAEAARSWAERLQC